MGLLELIEWISLHHPQDKRRILRSRIETTLKPSIVFRETIKLTAKRSSTDIAWRSGGECIESTAEFRPDPLAPISPPSLFHYETSYLQGRDRKPLYEQDRAVVAALWVDAENQPHAVRANRNHQVNAWHAELFLCLDVLKNAENFRGKRLLWIVGLKPCRMCAAWISTLMRELECKYHVVYARNDPGPLAQGTELDRLDGVQEPLSSWGLRNPEQARTVFGAVQAPSQTTV